jgi:Na+/H+ antiporter NhaD/arsenite permease-like protein
MTKLNWKKVLIYSLLYIGLLFFIFYITQIEETGIITKLPHEELDYYDGHLDNIGEILKNRIKKDPFNLIATIIFFLAITHSLFVNKFLIKAHKCELEHEQMVKDGKVSKESKSIKGNLYHFLGEVEVVFGLWAVILGILAAVYYDWHTFVEYVNSLSYREPIFIIVIMLIASSRPILKLFELFIWRIVKIFGGSLEAWWLALLIMSSFLSSFITGPAAMTIIALLLSDKFFSLNPSKPLKYTTLALLFVNISVGGAMTNFASPPVLMVADKWEWSMAFMFINFGWKSIIAITISTLIYFFIFKKEFKKLKKPYNDMMYKKYIQNRFISSKELEDKFEDLEKHVDMRLGFSNEVKALSFILKENMKEIARRKLTKDELELYDVNNAIEEKFETIASKQYRKTIPGLLSYEDRDIYQDPEWDSREDRVPLWVMGVHLLFMIWTILNAHETALFLAGFLFFLGFYQITSFYQNKIDFRPAMLVGFFLAGLIVHGTLQSWWIAPILGNLPPLGLNLASIILTSFNDNAAITYLSTLVPNFSDQMKYAVVSGAITGGGLTIIANAPNPIGQSILKPYFKSGIEAGNLLKYALMPTIVAMIIFLIL